MKARLTDIAVRKLPLPLTGDAKHWDETTPGFGVRCTAKSKSFIVMFGERRQLKTLGRYPDVSLSDARREAKQYLAHIPELNPKMSYVEALTAYLDDCTSRLRPNTLRVYRHFLTQLDFNGKVGDIRRSHLDLSDAHAVIAFKVFFNWCIRNDLVDRNPVAGERAVYNQRDRVLTDKELRAVYNYEDEPFSTIVKLLILTGQRRNEIASLHSAWITEDTITLPKVITKNKQPHTFPIGEMARPFLKGDGYLFGNKKGTSFSGFSKSKARLDKVVPMPHWTLHDLRRTYAVSMQRIGVSIQVTEALLNHVSGTRGGIVGIYQRYDYLKEMREAVLAYEQFLATLLKPMG